ncbi:hypothetical protein L1049_014648 [Liquidambar formosana]|uniref:Uncharacterized protein n=1 Tax=Liquidambar formosana TaxID=63359 RepID=A0AAP0S2B3_LIQFO
MASFQLLKSNFSPFSGKSEFSRKPTWIFSESCLESAGRRIVEFRIIRRSRYLIRHRFRVCCGVKEGENQSNGEEPPESLFMKELRRRGMTPTSLLEDRKKSIYELDEGVKLKEEDREFSKRNAVSRDFEKSPFNQRERSMALNSEGLEGLIPRAKILLTIGGTFFLGFGPLILITIAFFSALYLVSFFSSLLVCFMSLLCFHQPDIPYCVREDASWFQVLFRFFCYCLICCEAIPNMLLTSWCSRNGVPQKLNFGSS